MGTLLYCNFYRMGEAIHEVEERTHLLSDLMKGKYVALKKIAEDRKDLLIIRLIQEERSQHCTAMQSAMLI